ncbi:MAG: FHA domain-containing protein [Myxococcota bacterium]
MGVRLVVRSSWTRRTDAAELRFEFDQARVVIGRSAGADVQLPHPAVSNTHATLRAEGARYALVDEGSTNGCRVNGKRLIPHRAKPLRSGDLIEIGGFALTLEIGIAASPTSAQQTAELARLLVRDALDPDASGRIGAPRLEVLNGASKGAAIELPPPPASLVLGRGDTCDLTLPDADASREHVEILRDASGVKARDLDSKNGLLVNGITKNEAMLRDRDELQIGATIVVFEDPAKQALADVLQLPDEEIALPDPAPAEPEPEEPEEEPATGTGDVAAPTTDPTGPVTGAETPPPEAQVLTAPKAKGGSADLVVYVLAGTVLALSIAGLVWLLR